jgi:hypothetical protein
LKRLPLASNGVVNSFSTPEATRFELQRRLSRKHALANREALRAKKGLKLAIAALGFSSNAVGVGSALVAIDRRNIPGFLKLKGA